MKKEKPCKYCGEIFTPRRKNHLYCTSSYKTHASYKRNRYKYNPGHYQKDNAIKKIQDKRLSMPDNLESKLSTLTDKIEKLSVKNGNESINSGSVTNAAIGTASANAITFGLQKIIAPKRCLLQKNDIEELKRELNNLKKMLGSLNLKKAKSDISLSDMF